MTIQFTEDLRWGAYHLDHGWAWNEIAMLTWSDKAQTEAWIAKQVSYLQERYVALPFVKARQLMTAIIT